MRTEPIRIETDRVKKVRKHVESTRQTISGFIALAIDEKIERLNVMAVEAGLMRGTITTGNGILNSPTIVGEVGPELVIKRN